MTVNLTEDANILRMYESAEITQDRSPRYYLGMSSMGEDCDRKLWFDFRQVKLNWFPAKTLYAFADGHYSEDITADRLNAIPGIKLTVDDGTGNQFGYEDFGGHFRGHMDGKIIGISQAPEKLHVWEHKCSNQKTFNKFVKLRQTEEHKNVLEKWNPKYYAQAQLYMRYSDLDRHFLTVALAGSREYSAVRTERKKRVGERLRNRAGDIIASDKPLDGISDNPEYFECKWCNYKGLCYGEDIPRANCRTCIYSYPIVSGEGAQWHCQKFGANFSKSDYLQDCTSHLYIPKLLSHFADIVTVDRDKSCITYRSRLNGNEFINGPLLDQYLSIELANMPAPMIGEVIVNDLKATFGAHLEVPKCKISQSIDN